MAIIAGHVRYEIAAQVAAQTFAPPIEMQAGDVLLVLSASDTNPDGYEVRGNATGVFGQFSETSSSSPSHVMAYAVQSAVMDTQVTIDLINGRALPEVVVMAVLRGIDPAAPIAAGPVVASGSNGSPDPLPLTTSGRSIRVIAGFLDDDTVLATPPLGFGEQVSAFADGVSVMLAVQESASGGALDPAAFGGGGDDEWHATQVAFAPLAVATPLAPPTGLQAIIL